MTTTHENKGQSTSDIVLVILKNYNDARNNECKMKVYVGEEIKLGTNTSDELRTPAALLPGKRALRVH